MNKLKVLGAALNAFAFVAPSKAGKISLNLFMRPRRIKIHPQSQAYLAAARKVTLDYGAGLVGYQFEPTTTGASKGHVFLVHGWESHAARWVPLIKMLRANGFACTALDGPAAGASGGKDTPFNHYALATAAFAEKYGPFSAVVGHSLGGGVVAQLLRLLPRAQHPACAVIMASFDESEHVFARYMDMMGYSRRVQSSFDRQLVDVMGGYSPGRTVAEFSNTAALRSMQHVNGLIVHSRDDAVSPYCEGVALHEAWPGSSLISYEGEGHGLKSEHVHEDVCAWLLQANG